MKSVDRYRPPVLAADEMQLQGPRHAVDSQIRRLVTAGRLLELRDRTETRGRVTVIARVRPGAETPAPRAAMHPGWIVGIFTAAAAALAALAWLLTALAHLLIVAGLVVLGIVLAVSAAAVAIAHRERGPGGGVSVRIRQSVRVRR